MFLETFIPFFLLAQILCLDTDVRPDIVELVTIERRFVEMLFRRRHTVRAH